MATLEWSGDGALIATFSKPYTRTADLHNKLEQEFRREISQLYPVEIPDVFH